MKKAYLIIGPTSSGKSALALSIAGKYNGAVINADSMQIYKNIEILTASPTKEEKENLPHLLYNFLEPTENYSVAKYINDLKKTLEFCESDGKIPVIVGGTGMYINAAINGLAYMPEISIEAKKEAEEFLSKYGIEFLYKELEKLDPEIAAKLKSTDTHRILRSYLVKKETGNSILFYQKENSKPILSDYDLTIYYLKPERKFLHKLIEERFRKMIDFGVIEEVKNFREKYVDLKTRPPEKLATDRGFEGDSERRSGVYPNVHEDSSTESTYKSPAEVEFLGRSNSASKILGLKEIYNYLDGKISLEEMIEIYVIKTRQFAKRQFTWFNNKLDHKHEILEFSDIEGYKNLTC